MPANTDGATVGELLERRNQIRGWLARLDELTSDTAAHVASRVRADYEDRLAAVLAELATHLDAIVAEVERLRARLRDEGERYQTAVDELEETRLRYRIGELGDAEWGERQGALETDVATVAAARDAVSSELQRMEDLVAQVEGADQSAAIQPSDVVSSPRAGVTPLPSLDDRSFPWELPPIVGEHTPTPAAAQPDLEPPPPADFLVTLDRALLDAPADEDGSTVTQEEPDTRPGPGTRCPDCGYTNDPQAWYCGVCGADLN